MNRPNWTIERREIERIAREYEDQGYELKIAPRPSELPDFLQEYRPDIVARGSKDCLVIEAKQPIDQAERERIRGIAERVGSQPGWRFVLVSPEPSGRAVTGEPVDRPDDSDVRRLAQEARTLIIGGHQEAASIIGVGSG